MLTAMKPSSNFEAFWLPAFDSDADPDDVIAAGFEWLRSQEASRATRGVLAMYAAQMRRNRPILESAPWEIVSPRSRPRPYRIPVLAIWPDAKVLELAGFMATGAALCVIPYESADIAAWIERTNATALAPDFEAPHRSPVPADVEDELRHIVEFGGHNGFLGGGEKEVAIRAFHNIQRMRVTPTREAIEDYMRSTGGVNEDGVVRAGKWYEEVLEGKRHLDYRRQVIR